MKRLGAVLSSIWTAMNPREPSPAYLAILLASAVVLFVIAGLIGQM